MNSRLSRFRASWAFWVMRGRLDVRQIERSEHAL